MSVVHAPVKQQTKIFGISLGVDPKILIGGLIVLALVLFWFNSRGDDSSQATGTAAHVGTVPPPVSPFAARNRNNRRNRNVTADRGVIRIRPVDPSRGDIDPTLRLELLARLQTVSPAKPGRSLFEIGPEPSIEASSPPVPVGPVIPVDRKNQGSQLSGATGTPAGPLTPQVNIPLKFYGFVRPAEKGQNNQGLFLDGDNILVASEGQLIDHRYLVRELSALDARLEDTQIKQGQTLHVVPEAKSQ